MRIFLDNNMWDYFADNKVDLLSYFPKSEYELFITTHGKYEIFQISDNKRQYVKDYALEALKSIVKVDSIFGYYNDLFPIEYQRTSGYDVGRYPNENENEIRSELFAKYGTYEKRKKSQILFKQEADIELAVRSKDYPVITFDVKKNGPLLDALNNKWKIIALDLKRSKTIAVDKFMLEIILNIKNKRT